MFGGFDVRVGILVGDVMVIGVDGKREEIFGIDLRSDERGEGVEGGGGGDVLSVVGFDGMLKLVGGGKLGDRVDEDYKMVGFVELV